MRADLENIRFNLSVMGVPQGKMSGLIDDIVEFTELNAFIFIR